MSHPFKSECSLDEQRLSMVLELYYRKAGGKRESRREGEGEDPHTTRVLLILSSVRRGRTAIHLPLMPGWASKLLNYSLGGGRWWQVLPGIPGATLLKPLGLWERGMREEVPNTDESEQNLDEQRISMVLELYYRKAGRKRDGRRDRQTDRQTDRQRKG